MAGQVVHARQGRRDDYRPLISRLSSSSQPEAVLEGLLRLYPFQHCYIADLDAILGHGNHDAVIAGLCRAYPNIEFWLDAGLRNSDGSRFRQVLGSESLDATASPKNTDILSLDFRGDAFVGPAALLEDAARWPDDIIVMTLDRVGSGQGPDLERLTALRTRTPEKRFYAAGGVRGAADLAALTEIGVAGVLLATALHDGRLSPTDLAACHDSRPGDARNPARATGPGQDR